MKLIYIYISILLFILNNEVKSSNNIGNNDQINEEVPSVRYNFTYTIDYNILKLDFNDTLLKTIKIHTHTEKVFFSTSNSSFLVEVHKLCLNRNKELNLEIFLEKEPFTTSSEIVYCKKRFIDHLNSFFSWVRLFFISCNTSFLSPDCYGYYYTIFSILIFLTALLTCAYFFYLLITLFVNCFTFSWVVLKHVISHKKIYTFLIVIVVVVFLILFLVFFILHKKGIDTFNLEFFKIDK
jgi:hypothetical protein